MKTFLKNKYFKIILAIFLAFILVELSISNQVFLGESPNFNPLFLTKLINAPGNFIASIGNLVHPNPSKAFFSRLPKASPPPNALFRAVSKGVYAAEDPKTNIKYIKIINGTQVLVQTITLSDGRTITVVTPLAQ